MANDTITEIPYHTWFNDVLKLPQYHQKFINAGYINFTYLDDQIDAEELLQDIGITNKSHINKILYAIKKLVNLRLQQPINTEPNPLHITDSNDSKQDNEDIDNNLFDFSDDDDEQWDDLDIIPANEQIFTSYLDSVPPSNNEECWQCIKCNTMNNVQLTKRMYNYKCCGCADMYYIPSQTQTTYESKWDSPNDYLLKKNKIWICIQCTFVNKNMNTNKCCTCQCARFAKNIGHGANDMLCDICNQYINSLSFMMHQIHCARNIQKAICWTCPKCHSTEIKNESKCNVCDCKRPVKYHYFKVKLNQDLVYGFCRYYFRKDIPVMVKDIMMDFLAMRTFSISSNNLKNNPKNVTRHYNEGFVVKLYGDEFVSYPDRNVWKLKLNVDSKYDVRVDGDTDAAKVYDIRIGVWCLKDYFDKKSGKVKQREAYYTITGDGRYSYPVFRNNDVIIVELDIEQQTVSYGINEDWYGVAFEQLPQYTKYQLYVEVKQQGVIVNLVN